VKSQSLYRGIPISCRRRGASDTIDDKELLAEIGRLREDLKQLREIVNVLVTVVMEEEFEEEEQEFPSYPNPENRFNILN
jgi:hypothetical protein